MSRAKTPGAMHTIEEVMRTNRIRILNDLQLGEIGYILNHYHDLLMKKEIMEGFEKDMEMRYGKGNSPIILTTPEILREKTTVKIKNLIQKAVDETVEKEKQQYFIMMDQTMKLFGRREDELEKQVNELTKKLSSARAELDKITATQEQIQNLENLNW